jgi:hypothetical protein
VPPEPFAVKVPGEVLKQIGDEPPLMLAVKLEFTVIVIEEVLTVPHGPLVTAQ